ncbi:MAG: Amidohydrolase [Actinobacteria bacterium ADurb.Bin444]|nr:MAG: Amidohydrolase [Actinobacteria bacterium ADurb.Bin444]
MVESVLADVQLDDADWVRETGCRDQHLRDGGIVAQGVIDLHVHLPLPGFWREGQIALARDLSPDIFHERHRFADPSYLVHYFEDQRVDYAVVMAEESPKVTGLIGNDFVLDYCSRSAGRLLMFMALDPLPSPKALPELERMASAEVVVGIKLLPSYQHFRPDDPALFPVYERAQELGLAITFHTGSSIFPGTREELADPRLLEPVVAAFPQLRILMAHGGRRFWYREAEEMVMRHPNVYLEISGLPPQRLPVYFPHLHELTDKVIFGSDFPMVPSISRNVEAVCSLFGRAGARRVLWENAVGLLKDRLPTEVLMDTTRPPSPS